MYLFVYLGPSKIIKAKNINLHSQRRGVLYVWNGLFVEWSTPRKFKTIDRFTLVILII